MTVPDRSKPAGRLLIASLASYSEACKPPTLTPGCPFYRAMLDGPSCGEECRQLLRLAGEPVPAGAVNPPAFDARQQYLSEQNLPAHKQATGSLLLTIADALELPAHPNVGAIVVPVAHELSRRGISARDLVAAAMLPNVAGSVAVLSLLPELLDSDVIRVPGIPAALADIWRPWAAMLDAAIAGEGGDRAALRAAGRDGHVTLAALTAANTELDLSALRGVPADMAQLPEGLSPHAVAAHPRLSTRLMYSLSDRFLNRVHRWLEAQLPQNLSDFTGWPSPDVVQFLGMSMESLPSRSRERWIWDRFTLTYPREWRFESIRSEWAYVHGRLAPPCPPKTMTARSVALHELADAVMSRPTSPATPASSHGLTTVDFVEVAAARLRHGRASEAAALFAGVVELRPDDADARNNYGFCLMPTNPAAALVELEEAKRLGVRPPLINSANRALTLHLLNRDDEALSLAERTLAAIKDSSSGAFLWWHECESQQLRLQENADPRAALTWLRDHLAR